MEIQQQNWSISHRILKEACRPVFKIAGRYRGWYFKRPRKSYGIVLTAPLSWLMTVDMNTSFKDSSRAPLARWNLHSSIHWAFTDDCSQIIKWYWYLHKCFQRLFCLAVRAEKNKANINFHLSRTFKHHAREFWSTLKIT